MPSAKPGDTEEVDALPVLAPVRVLERPADEVDDQRARLEQWQAVPPVAVQAAAVAATSFVAGAAAVVAVHRRRARRAARKRRPARTRGQLVEVVASRSFLVDVHLLGGRD